MRRDEARGRLGARAGEGVLDFLPALAVPAHLDDGHDAYSGLRLRWKHAVRMHPAQCVEETIEIDGERQPGGKTLEKHPVMPVLTDPAVEGERDQRADQVQEHDGIREAVFDGTADQIHVGDAVARSGVAEEGGFVGRNRTSLE